jgi:hypothetical protein
MVAVPAVLPRTTPVVDTDAMAALLLLHVPATVVSVNVVVAPAQTVVAPEIAPTTGVVQLEVTLPTTLRP